MTCILAAVDLSPVAEDVIATASSLARALGAELVLLHVAAPDPEFVGYEVGPPAVREERAETLRSEHRALQARAEALREGGLDARALLIQGPTVEKILSEADSVGADWLVIGSHGHGALYDVLLGSVGHGVLRQSTRPVVVVPDRRRQRG